jgi:RNA polymerase sigma-70 factor (ECF subfamily)
MTGPGPAVSIERLVEHRDFVRRLARSLTGDSHDSDDLEQDVWLTTLRNPPRHADALFGWFRRVTRTRAIDRARGDARRDELQDPAGERAAPSAAELAARLDAGRRVAAAVARLDDPYRSIVLLRFYDDLAPSVIASRTGVPVETVRTRLRRAIERLREDLDGDAGGREAWVAAVLPLAGGTARHAAEGTTGVLIAGGAAMGAKLTIAAAAAGAVIGSLVTVQFARPAATADGGQAAAVAADVRELARRVGAVETRAQQAAPTAAPARADARGRAQDERIAALEATVADLQKRATAAPEAASPPAARPADAPKADETAESLRRIVVDTTQTESKRLEAFAKLRGMPSGFTPEVILAVRDIFRATAFAETRDAILRDLHNVKDETLLPEVRALFVAGLHDPDEKVRERAARDADAFASDAAVRQALETARDGDTSELVRARAARSLR